MNLSEAIKAARRVSAPIVAISTPDPAATVELVRMSCENASAVVEWTMTLGAMPLNEAAKDWKAGQVSGRDPSVNNPAEFAKLAATLPRQSIAFVHMAHRFMDAPAFIQAVWILRDLFKQDERTLVLLGPSMKLPPELHTDALVYDEPLPDADALRNIVADVHTDADIAQPDESLMEKSVAAVQGLSAFQAEQVSAMAMTRDGVDVDRLWDQKLAQIDSVPGLKVYRGTESFDDIGGIPVAKEFLRKIVTGREAPNAVVFIDEIEKALAGSTGDTSGVTQDQVGGLLSHMQDTNAVGIICLGPPGAAKSLLAKATGNEAGVPLMQLDLGGMKGSLVGQSQNQLRAALKTISAVSNDRTLWIATCNSITALPPELRRRFTLGQMFFDLPDETERDAIWQIHMAAYDIPEGEERPNDVGWTGAEIRQCCDIAWRMETTLIEASEFIVPVSVSAKAQIDDLRSAADGRFLSASVPGVYRKDQADKPSGRKRRSVSTS